jgi:protein-tyrosine kinase
MQAITNLSDESKEAHGIIYPGMPNRAMLNIYRDLRNKLLRLSDYQNFVCLISALAPNGETARLTINLAAVFAFDKSRSSIVIDCDTNPNLIEDLARDEDGNGLIDFIENELDDVSVLIQESGIERLRIIPAGNVIETRTESLESVRMREIVSELKRRYPDRYIFINAPSMKTSSEVQVLSNVSDSVIFQLDSGAVDESQVVDAVEMIGAEKVAGIVFSGQ